MSIPSNFKKYELATPRMPDRWRLVMSSEADTGCGKSSFALRTMPRPLLIIDADDNLEPIMGSYLKDPDVYIHKVLISADYEGGKKSHQERDRKVWDEMMSLYGDALTSGYFRSVMMDGGQDIWELCRRAFLTNGGMDFGSDKRTDYAVPNAAMTSIFDMAKASDCNFYITSAVKDEYKGANATGRKVAAGWKPLVQKSQLHLRFYKDLGEPMPNKFKCEILKCSANSAIEAEILEGDDIDFRMLGMKVYPVTEESMEVWA